MYLLIFFVIFLNSSISLCLYLFIYFYYLLSYLFVCLFIFFLMSGDVRYFCEGILIDATASPKSKLRFATTPHKNGGALKNVL